MRKLLVAALILGFTVSSVNLAQARVGPKGSKIVKKTHHNPHKPGPRSNSEPAPVPVKH